MADLKQEYALINIAFANMPYGAACNFERISEKSLPAIALTTVLQNLERLTAVLGDVVTASSDQQKDLERYRRAIGGVRDLMRIISKEQ